MRREQVLHLVRYGDRRQTGTRRPLLLPRPSALLLPPLALWGAGPRLSPQAIARRRLGRVRRVRPRLPGQLLDLALQLPDPARHAGLLLLQPVSLRLQFLDPPISRQQPREQLPLTLGDVDRRRDGKVGEHRARHHNQPPHLSADPHPPSPGSGPLSRLRADLNSYQAHAAAGSRHRVQDHYLRGSLFCASCGARLSDGVSKGRGGYYHYFFCLGRQTHRNGCREVYVPAEDLEKQIELLWFRVEIPQWLRKKIKSDAARRIPERYGEVEHEFAAARRRLAELEEERRRLRDAYLAGAMPMDLLKEAQDRLAEEVRTLEAKAPPQAHTEVIEQMLDRAFGYADQVRDAYLRALPHERRAWNQHGFKGF